MHPAVAGVILFASNYAEPQQLMQLTQAIKSTRSDLLLTVDHEGGRVQRFIDGFTHLPSAHQLAEAYVNEPEQVEDNCFRTGQLMAEELRPYQIDLNFAPVLDLDYGISTVISTRSFHAEAPVVIRLAKALLAGMQSKQLAGCAKHFPGHGGVIADSHTSLPVDRRSFEQIWQSDIQPFLVLSASLSYVMSAHVIYQQVDTMPASFSEFWLREILRKRLGFRGKIFSDDLTMQAAKAYGSATERVGLALQAGCDYVLLCHDPAGVEAVLSDNELSAF